MKYYTTRRDSTWIYKTIDGMLFHTMYMQPASISVCRMDDSFRLRDGETLRTSSTFEELL